MNITNAFRLSVNNILHRQLRSWLTLLGIIIGVAAVVSIVSIGEGAQASVAENLSGLGADIMTVSPGFSRAGSFGGAFRGGMSRIPNFGSDSESDDPTITKRDAITIRANPKVEYVTEIVSGRGSLVFLDEEANINIQGVNPVTWEETAYLNLDSGRFLSASDSAAIVIGYRLANDLFKQPVTIGRRVSIEGKAFTVVGIIEDSGSGGFGGNNGTTVYMPYTSAWEITDTEKDTFSSIQIKVSDPELIAQVTEELTNALRLSRKVTEEDQDFSISSSQEIQEQISETTQTLTIFLAAIAAISLLVGAIGVANSMFTSVLEKTREIGILKALGSTNNEILRLFIIESGLFGLVGGILGVLLGMLASMLLGAVSGISLPMMRGGFSTLVSPQLIIIAIALSTAIGVFSGVMPAMAASKLKPVEALRYE